MNYKGGKKNTYLKYLPIGELVESFNSEDQMNITRRIRIHAQIGEEISIKWDGRVIKVLSPFVKPIEFIHACAESIEQVTDCIVMQATHGFILDDETYERIGYYYRALTTDQQL